MRLARRQLLCLGASAAALPIFSRLAGAQVYPSRPVTIIVPVPPGGVADPIARILADYLSAKLGEPVVVENVTGAGGSIGVARAARATPDGYTLSIGTLTSHVLTGGLYKLDFDVLTDLTPIAQVAYEPLLICIKNNLPVHNLQELIVWLKAN